MSTREKINPGNPKTANLFLLLTFLAWALVIPTSAAGQGTATNGTSRFVTMDPVGDHSVGDTFFINGTTNVPSFNNSLFLQITPGTFNPSGFGYYFSSTVSIQPGEQGINTWSCEILPSGWQYLPNSTGFTDRNVTPGAYYVSAVYPHPPDNAIAGETFTLLPAVANPVITIDPVANHTIGDLITVTGMTNVPAGTVLAISAGPSTFTNYRPNYFIGQTTVAQGTGTNTWSAILNTTDFIADQYHLTVAPVNGYALSNATLFTITSGSHPSAPTEIPLMLPPVSSLSSPAGSHPVPPESPLSSFIPVTGVGAVCVALGALRKMRRL